MTEHGKISVCKKAGGSLQMFKNKRHTTPVDGVPHGTKIVEIFEAFNFPLLSWRRQFPLGVVKLVRTLYPLLLTSSIRAKPLGCLGVIHSFSEQRYVARYITALSSWRWQFSTIPLDDGCYAVGCQYPIAHQGVSTNHIRNSSRWSVVIWFGVQKSSYPN